MVEFRINKKEKQKRLVAEHHRLEREMKTLVETVRTAAACCSGESVTAMLQELVVEREALRNQNMALREEITRYEKFTIAALEASQDPMEREQSNLLPRDEAGWRVGEGDTSFYFHPFTRDEVDAEMRRFESELVDSTRLVARTRVTKCLRCSLDVHTQMSYTKQKDLSPMIVTLIGCGLHQRGKADTHVLQEFDQDALVFAHDIPGPEKHPAICFKFGELSGNWQTGDESRDADSQDNVEWATEGGIQVSVTEMDEKSIKVVCDHWASCESKLHAEYLMIQWTQFAVWWEQLTEPSNLLLNTT
ncbi:hypothetical protein GQ600_16048 [Phytophthora cactorum]|nr:hypothetical protein GQ600_16048 [Phytophthora cactorum]